MDCRTCTQLLDEYLLGTLDDVNGQRVATHVGQCRDCRARLRTLSAALDRSLSASDMPSLSPSETSVLRDTLHTTLREELWGGSHLTPARALAAAALMVLAAGSALLSAWLVATADPHSHVMGSHASEILWELSGTRTRETTDAYAPALMRERAYVVQSQPEYDLISAVELADGAVAWRSTVPSQGYVSAGPKLVCTVSDEQQFRGDLLALDRATGGLRWRFSPRETRLPTAAVVQGEHVVWACGRELHVLSALRGAEVWSYRSRRAYPVSAPVVSGHRVVCVDGGEAVCHDLRTGERRWTLPVDESHVSLLRAHLDHDRSRVYVAQHGEAMQGIISCIDIDDGKLVWQRSDIAASQVHVAGGTLFVRGHGLRALDAATGRLRWSRPAAGCSPMVYAHNVIMYTDAARPHALIVREASTGALVRELALYNSCTGVTIDGSTGLVNSNDGTLHAFRTDRFLGRPGSL